MKYLLTSLFLYTVVPAWAQHRARVSSGEVTGIFVDKRGSEFRLTALGNNRLRVRFKGIQAYGPPVKQGRSVQSVANSSIVSGMGEIRADTVVFRFDGQYHTCPITIWFRKPGYIQVGQGTNGCAGSYDLHASGNYYKAGSPTHEAGKAP